jgi:hypothetical protein
MLKYLCLIIIGIILYILINSIEKFNIGIPLYNITFNNDPQTNNGSLWINIQDITQQAEGGGIQVVDEHNIGDIIRSSDNIQLISENIIDAVNQLNDIIRKYNNIHEEDPDIQNIPYYNLLNLNLNLEGIFLQVDYEQELNDILMSLTNRDLNYIIINGFINFRGLNDPILNNLFTGVGEVGHQQLGVEERINPNNKESLVEYLISNIDINRYKIEKRQTMLSRILNLDTPSETKISIDALNNIVETWNNWTMEWLQKVITESEGRSVIVLEDLPTYTRNYSLRYIDRRYKLVEDNSEGDSDLAFFECNPDISIIIEKASRLLLHRKNLGGDVVIAFIFTDIINDFLELFRGINYMNDDFNNWVILGILPDDITEWINSENPYKDGESPYARMNDEVFKNIRIDLINTLRVNLQNKTKCAVKISDPPLVLFTDYDPSKYPENFEFDSSIGGVDSWFEANDFNIALMEKLIQALEIKTGSRNESQWVYILEELRTNEQIIEYIRSAGVSMD